MLSAINHIWRECLRKAETRRLADRLGPHMARDIGIDTSAMPERRDWHASPLILPKHPRD